MSGFNTQVGNFLLTLSWKMRMWSLKML